MRNAVVMAAVLGAIAPSTGCFTVLGGISGSMHDPDSLPPPREIQPRRLPTGDDLPPGWRLSEEPPPPPPQRETGMSNAAKGLIGGAIVDALLVGLVWYATKDLDWEWGCSGGGC